MAAGAFRRLKFAEQEPVPVLFSVPSVPPW